MKDKEKLICQILGLETPFNIKNKATVKPIQQYCLITEAFLLCLFFFCFRAKDLSSDMTAQNYSIQSPKALQQNRQVIWTCKSLKLEKYFHSWM
jgi:hypothetical protein